MGVNSPAIPSWEIEYQCPQCGAPVILQEADRLFTCSYCRVRLYVTANDLFRYYLPPKKRVPSEILFLPYWRFRGIAFSCIPYEVRHRIIDSSLLALQDKSFPPSLGLRPQTLRLKLFSPEVEGRFLKPQLSFSEGGLRIERQLEVFDSHEIKPSSFVGAFIGEGISLIYSPLSIEGGFFCDAILGSRLAPVRGTGTDQLGPADQHRGWQLSFISTLCPNCGNDLQGEKESLVLLCESCQSAWRPSGAGLERTGFAVVPGGEEENLYYLPFWRMKVKIDGVEIKSYADLVRMANLPKIIREEWEDQDIYFWSPAFKINPLLFLRLSKQMTLSARAERLEAEIPRATLHPVTLSSTQAAESITVNLANLSVDKRKVFPELAKIKIRLEESLLLYTPFVQKGNELIHPHLGFSLQKNALRMGIYL
jgi:DNA-directed RNA polymerase subunit RPC12/RpoP